MRAGGRGLGQAGVGAAPAARGGLRRGAGAAGGLGERVAVQARGGGTAGVPVDDAEDVDGVRVDLGGLRRRRAAEPGRQRALAHDGDLRLALDAAQDGGGELERARHPMPTCTPRKRAGATPWETAIICPGSPLPQLSSPCTSQASREQTASSADQKRGVTPA